MPYARVGETLILFSFTKKWVFVLLKNDEKYYDWVRHPSWIKLENIKDNV